jgi:hypothetical protein
LQILFFTNDRPIKFINYNSKNLVTADLQIHFIRFFRPTRSFFSFLFELFVLFVIQESIKDIFRNWLFAAAMVTTIIKYLRLQTDTAAANITKFIISHD